MKLSLTGLFPLNSQGFGPSTSSQRRRSDNSSFWKVDLRRHDVFDSAGGCPTPSCMASRPRNSRIPSPQPSPTSSPQGLSSPISFEPILRTIPRRADLRSLLTTSQDLGGVDATDAVRAAEDSSRRGSPGSEGGALAASQPGASGEVADVGGLHLGKQRRDVESEEQLHHSSS